MQVQGRLSKSRTLRAARRWETRRGGAQPEVPRRPRVTSFKQASPTPNCPAVISGQGGARVSRLLEAGAVSAGRPSSGAGDQGARPQPRARGGVAGTHRAWPRCRPRRAGSPRGRAPPAGRCCPPCSPAARAAAALCSEPWARGHQGSDARHLQEFHLAWRLPARRRLLPVGLAIASSSSSSSAQAGPPGAGEGARQTPGPAPPRCRAPPSGEDEAGAREARPGRGSGKAGRRLPASPGPDRGSPGGGRGSPPCRGRPPGTKIPHIPGRGGGGCPRGALPAPGSSRRLRPYMGSPARPALRGRNHPRRSPSWSAERPRLPLSATSASLGGSLQISVPRLPRG